MFCASSKEYFSIFFILIVVREKLIERFHSHADWYVKLCDGKGAISWHSLRSDYLTYDIIETGTLYLIILNISIMQRCGYRFLTVSNFIFLNIGLLDSLV